MNHYFQNFIKKNSNKIKYFEDRILYHLNQSNDSIKDNRTLIELFENDPQEKIKAVHSNRLFYSFALVLDINKHEYTKKISYDMHNSVYFSIDFRNKTTTLQSVSLKTDYGSIVLNNSGISFFLDIDDGNLETLRFKNINSDLVHDESCSYDEDFISNGMCITEFCDNDKIVLFNCFRTLRKVSKDNSKEVLDFLLNSNEIPQETIEIFKITRDIDLSTLESSMNQLTIKITEKNFNNSFSHQINKKPS